MRAVHCELVESAPQQALVQKVGMRLSRFPSQAAGMLFAIKYQPSANRTEGDRRTVRELFVAWKPPERAELQAHYHFVSGGGVLILEASDAGPLFESLEPFKPYVEFDIEPVVNMLEAVAISLDVEEWATSILGPPHD